jgi:hypothetical protein
MPVPSLDCLRTPANGQILAIEKATSKSAVEAALTTASARSSGRAVVREVRQKRTTKDGDCWASLVSFPITDTPAFFLSTALKEHTYGFLLLLEIQADGKWFLGVFKKSLASIANWLDDKARHLPRTKLTNAFSERSSRHQTEPTADYCFAARTPRRVLRSSRSANEPTNDGGEPMCHPLRSVQ